MTELTQEYLQSVLEYNSFTGLFTWTKNKPRSVKVGDVAGSVHPKGYIRIRLQGKQYLAHRLVWLYVYGRWPKEQIDHVNGIRGDNRLTNLRECNREQNRHNSLGHLKAVIPYKGVSRTASGSYRALLQHGEHKYSLGCYKTPEEAKEAYDLKAKELQGEFYTERTK
jgi:hypothetical protein